MIVLSAGWVGWTQMTGSSAASLSCGTGCVSTVAETSSTFSCNAARVACSALTPIHTKESKHRPISMTGKAADRLVSFTVFTSIDLKSVSRLIPLQQQAHLLPQRAQCALLRRGYSASVDIWRQ